MNIRSLEDLMNVQDDLDVKLQSGLLSRREYDREWNDALRTFGWTSDQYEAEIDRRWDYIDQMRAVPPRLRSMTN
jgi:hypothetical protein